MAVGMKRNGKFFAVTLCVVFMCGCGSAEKSPTATAKENFATEQSESEKASIKIPAAPSEISTDSEAPFAKRTELSAEECKFFTNFIQEVENYGFLLSDYDTPHDVHLDPVFYIGAGIGEEIPKEDLPRYLAATGQEELMTDCLKLPRQSIEDFLQRKLGIGLRDIHTPFEWLYLSEFDSYYHEAGDTNYFLFSCTEGSRQENIYTLRFTPEEDWGSLLSGCETVLIKTEGEYRFVSNHFLTE
ncbi:MAG: hypothetical protein HFE84_06380 [Lachnospiraceae bacterium]|nr:hypothetical protein [Lachnospiraceae bacterium]